MLQVLKYTHKKNIQGCVFLLNHFVTYRLLIGQILVTYSVFSKFLGDKMCAVHFNYNDFKKKCILH